MIQSSARRTLVSAIFAVALSLLATSATRAATILSKAGSVVTGQAPLWVGLPASNIYDGNAATVSHPQGMQQAGFFYEINLGGANVAGQGIEQIDFTNRADCCAERLHNYRVEILDHTRASVFTTDVRTGLPADHSPVGGVDVVDVASLNGGSSVIGQYVRISRLTPNNNYAVQIAEVDVHADAANGATVALQNATAIRSQANYSVDNAIDGLLGAGANTGWGNNTEGANTAAFETVDDLGYGTLTFTLDARSHADHNIGNFRISATTDDRSLFADGLDNGGDVTANWTELVALSAVSRNGDTLNILGDNSILLADEPNSSNADDIYTITAITPFSGITGFRLEALTDGSLPSNGPGTPPNGNFVLTEFTVNFQATPEPSSIVLFLSGLIGVMLCTRRRRESMAIVTVLFVGFATSAAEATVVAPPTVTGGSADFSGSYVKANATDSTKAQYASLNAGVSTFLELDFGGAATFDRVVMVQRDTGGPSEMFKQVTFTHPVAGSNTFSLTDPAPQIRRSPIYTLASPVTASTLRWDVDTLLSGTTGNTGVSELIFLNTPENTRILENVSATGFATQFSGTYAGANAANGFVGYDTTNTEYASQGQGAGMFIEFDLGETVVLDGFDYIDRFSSGDWTNTFTMTYSLDSIFGNGDDVVQLYDKTGSLTHSESSLNLLARYVRLDAVTVAGNNTGAAELIFYAATPEPTSAVLAMLGLMGVCFHRRRRR